MYKTFFTIIVAIIIVIMYTFLCMLFLGMSDYVNPIISFIHYIATYIHPALCNRRLYNTVYVAQFNTYV